VYQRFGGPYCLLLWGRNGESRDGGSLFRDWADGTMIGQSKSRNGEPFRKREIGKDLFRARC